MKALVLRDGAARVVHDHPEPQRAAGEARVRVRLAGVCDTDLQLARGYMGFSGVPGHEFVGEVIEADDPARVGRRVVADINAGCGKCADCVQRDGHHCAERTVLGIVARDGAFAEQLVMPERCLVDVPDSVDDRRAVFAEPLAAGLHVLDDVEHVSPEDSIVVLGDGKLGLMIATALASAGRRVAVVGHHRHKLELAERAGASAHLESELCGTLDGAAAVVEATGSESGLAAALGLLRPRGTLVLKTTVAGKPAIDWAPIVINELRVVGSRCGNMRRAIELLAQGADPSVLVQATFPLIEADRALERAAARGTLKVLIEA